MPFILEWLDCVASEFNCEFNFILFFNFFKIEFNLIFFKITDCIFSN